MAYTFRTSAEAERDLNEVAKYIAEENPNAAIRFIDAYIETCEMLAGMPEAGSLMPTILNALQGIRMFRVARFRKFLIFYKPLKEKGIEVVRIIHVARDYPTLFEE